MIQRFGIIIMLCACGEHRGGIGVSDDASSDLRIDARTTDAGGTTSDARPGDGSPLPTLDAPPDYGYGGVSCGATTCGPVETCCLDDHGNATCAEPGTCPSGSRSLCDGPEDCVLQNVCCGSNEGTTTKECRPDNQCTSSGLTYVCYTDADCVAYDNNFTKCCDSPLSIHKQCRPTCH